MKNKNYSLIIALLLPVLLMLVIALNIYWPRLWINPPKFNFVYIINTSYYPAKEYFVENNKIMEKEKIYPGQMNAVQPLGQVKLYLHDVTANQGREITYAEAGQLKLDGNYISPDGFQIAYGTGGGDSFFPFFFYSNRDYDSLYIKKENYTKKLNLVTPYSYYSYNYYNRVPFIGWIIP